MPLEVKRKSQSSQHVARRYLVGRRQAERILRDIANSPEDSALYVFSLHADLFHGALEARKKQGLPASKGKTEPTVSLRLSPQAQKTFEALRGILAAMQQYLGTPEIQKIFRELEQEKKRLVLSIRDCLREAWAASDARQREWWIYEARRLSLLWKRRAWKLAPSAKRTLPPPELTLFEQVMVHFQRLGPRARKCKNPACATPYFFRGKRDQSYCSYECAKPAILAAKRKWWTANRSKEAKKRRRK